LNGFEDDTIYVSPFNEAFIRVRGTEAVEMHLSDHLKFRSPTARWSKKVKMRLQTGDVYLYNRKDHLVLKGLYNRILLFARVNNYKIKSTLTDEATVPMERAESYASKVLVNIKDKGAVHLDKYQQDAVAKAIHYERLLLLSPTSSGKSAMMYAMVRWYLSYKKRIVIIVPSTWLVDQMYQDFVQYAKDIDPKFDPEKTFHRLYSGQPRKFSQPCLITTWQTLSLLETKFFNGFDVIIGDEAHGFNAKVLSLMMKTNVRSKVRIGMTGTIDDLKVHLYNLEGYFGPTYQVSTTKTLMDEGRVSQLSIEFICLNYKNFDQLLESKGYASKHRLEYTEEVDLIQNVQKRTDFIAQLGAKVIKGTTLILFQNIAHGKAIVESLKAMNLDDIDVHYIDGQVEVDGRQEIKSIVESSKRHVIVASYGVLRQGVSIPSIDAIIFAHPTKSKIRSLQSIGRGLRLKDGKSSCTLYDIVDIFSSAGRASYCSVHGRERASFYQAEQFDMNIRRLNLEL